MPASSRTSSPIAKSVAGGVPLSAVIGKAEIMDAPGPGGLGGTYAGSPLGCAAGLAVLEVMREEKLLERAQEIGRFMSSRLKGLQARFPCIGEVRGLGAMVAIELVKNRRADAPDAELTKALVQAAGRRGLVILLLRHVLQRHPLPRAADDLATRCSRRACNLFEQALATEVAGTRRSAGRSAGLSARGAAAAQARPAFASVGRVEVLALGGELLDQASSAPPCGPSAVLMGMQSWQRGSPQGWREYSQY